MAEASFAWLKSSRPGRAGNGTLLLPINGLGASLELLEPVVEALDGIATIRIDLPGTGGSPLR